MRRSPRLLALARDRRGVTAIEFAIVAPVMAILIMGLGDLAFQVYAQAILDGAMQKAGRDSSIQGGAETTGTIDAAVLSQVKRINTTASIYKTERLNYDNFGAVKPEDFVDTNGNGKRDAGECFTDINNNGTWDADPGSAGQGGANDVTKFTMTIRYSHPFPIMGMFGLSPTNDITSQTLLKNQPYASQTTTTAKTVCT